jgi:hypothetical protein
MGDPGAFVAAATGPTGIGSALDGCLAAMDGDIRGM